MEKCEFIHPVKQYLDYLAALERSPNILGSYCCYLRYYFTFLEQAKLDWRAWREVKPDELAAFIQWLGNPLRQVGVHPLRSESVLTERSVNIILTAVNSFYRYHIQHGEQLSNSLVYEQIPDRFSGFKRFLIRTSLGRITRRVLKLKEPKKRAKTSSSSWPRFRKTTCSFDSSCCS